MRIQDDAAGRICEGLEAFVLGSDEKHAGYRCKCGDLLPINKWIVHVGLNFLLHQEIEKKDGRAPDCQIGFWLERLSKNDDRQLVLMLNDEVGEPILFSRIGKV